VVTGLLFPVTSSANITFSAEGAPFINPGDQAYGVATGDVDADGRPKAKKKKTKSKK
jgi:hypothetical protein